MIKFFTKAVLAGIMIAVGSLTYINASTYVGAFMFSIGLLSIFHFNLSLFTGVIPYVDSMKQLLYSFVILLGNVTGCLVMIFFPSDVSKMIVENKLNHSYLYIILVSMMCNVLIYMAVEANKKHNIVLVVMSVMAFILCGFNHSIANVCFVLSARIFSVQSLMLILLSIVGNMIGGIMFRKVVVYASGKDREKLCG